MCKEMKNEKLMEFKSTIQFEPVKREPIKCEPIKCETIKCEPKRSKTPYLCEICKQTCVSFIKLEIHKRIHTGEKPYSCSSCNLNFRHKTSLKTHELIHKGGKPVHKCEFCDTTLASKQYLHKHWI